MLSQTLATPPADGADAQYLQNAAPLVPAALQALPLGSVQPRGWLAGQLTLMIDGMAGRLTELSGFLADDNGWLGGQADAKFSAAVAPAKGEGWEEQPYWFRGFYDLAVLTGDARLGTISRQWIEALFASQDPDGYFGPAWAKARRMVNGKIVCDLWGHMVMLDALVSHYEATGDQRVPTLMRRFFEFCRQLPVEQFIPAVSLRPDGYDWEPYGDWRVFIQWDRAGDMLPHIHWLYSLLAQQGQRLDWLLDLGHRFWQRNKPPVSEWLDEHVVNFAQRFRYFGSYYTQTRQRWHLEASSYWYGQHMATWGQQPGGIFAGDEKLRHGATDPRQAMETCGMVEFAKSFYILGRLTGEGTWADRAEDILLNQFPAAQTPDLKGLHYITASNMVQLDKSTNHKYHNEETAHWGNHVIFSPHKYRCCQHNHAMGWPWMARNLFQATTDGGLCAWMYAPCRVRAKVGPRAGGATATLDVETKYPFDGEVTVTVSELAGQATFPLYFRIPAWCNGASVRVNGRVLDAAPAAGTYLRLEEQWRAGDRIELTLPMPVRAQRWARNGSVTVRRGPLAFSVKIGEQWHRVGGTHEWPEWEVLPTTAWNFGLCGDEQQIEQSAKVQQTGTVADQPWTPEAAPVTITLTARRIPGWTLEQETVQELRPSPIRSREHDEPVTLIPMGCARLRLSCLPTVGEGPAAREW